MSDPLRTWLSVVAPGADDAAEALRTIPVRPVYEEPAPDTRSALRRWWGAEWSVRVGLDSGAIDTARVMVPVDTPRVAPSGLSQALSSLAPASPPRLRRLADLLRRDRPDLDLLLGLDLGAAVARGKLYVMRPAGRPVADFADVCRAVLSQARVDAGWTSARLDEAGRHPAFLALDLRDDGAAAGKLYLSCDTVAEADRLLAVADRPRLRARLRAVTGHLGDHRIGRLVVTVRGRGAETVDVTLHAHLHGLPALDPRTTAAFASLSAEASARGLVLRPSYASWLDGPHPAESLYYVTRPIPGDGPGSARSAPPR